MPPSRAVPTLPTREGPAEQRPPARIRVAGAPAGGRSEGLSLRHIWASLRANRLLLLAVFGATVLAAAVYTYTRRPVYESFSTLRIDNQAGSQKSLLGALAPVTGSLGQGTSLETEMMVLRSRQIAEPVVDSLALPLHLLAPQAPRDSVIRALSIPRDAPAGTFVLHRLGGGAYRLEAEGKGPSVPRVPGRVQAGTPFQIGSAVLALAPALRGGGPGEIRFSLWRFRDAVAELQHDLDVSRPDPKADVLEIRYRNGDARLAAAVPNALSHTFVAYKLQITRTESQNAVAFLRGQVDNYERELASAEVQLRDFRQSARVLSPKDEAAEQVQRLSKAQVEREDLVKERDALSRLLARVRAAPSGAPVSPYRQLASFPVFLSNRAVQDLLQSLTTIENRRAELLVQRSSQNPDVQVLTHRIQDIELQLYQLAQNYLDGLESQITAADQSLAAFDAQLQTIPGRDLNFARLTRRESLVADVYTLLQTRLKEAEIREASQAADVRVIDDALVPPAPVSPKPLQNLLLAAILGMVLGVGAVFARESLDTRVRSREDVAAATGGVPVIGTIPRILAPGANGRGLRRGAASPHPPLATRDDPWSPAAEAYRALRTSITFTGRDEGPSTVVITSAMPGEGKSTTSANLAITLAQQGVRTVLVDADLRRGTLHHALGMQRDPGLSHLLLRKAPLDDVLQEVEVGNPGNPLRFIGSGVLAPNPSELLGSPELARVLAELRERFDMVIFDAPPLRLVTDAAILARRVECCLVVTRANYSDRQVLHEAVGQLQQMDSPVTGVVLNDVPAAQSYYGYGSLHRDDGSHVLPPSSNGRH
jgi:capsular exopolysaccharide synthesis family protein